MNAPISRMQHLIAATFNAAATRLVNAIKGKPQWVAAPTYPKPDNLNPARGANETQAQYRERRAAINAWSSLALRPQPSVQFHQHTNQAKNLRRRDKRTCGSARQYRHLRAAASAWNRVNDRVEAVHAA